MSKYSLDCITQGIIGDAPDCLIGGMLGGKIPGPLLVNIKSHAKASAQLRLGRATCRQVYYLLGKGRTDTSLRFYSPIDIIKWGQCNIIPSHDEVKFRHKESDGCIDLLPHDKDTLVKFFEFSLHSRNRLVWRMTVAIASRYSKVSIVTTLGERIKWTFFN